MVKKKVLVPLITLLVVILLSGSIVLALFLTNRTNDTMVDADSDKNIEQKVYTISDEVSSDFAVYVDSHGKKSIDNSVVVTAPNGDEVDFRIKEMDNSKFGIYSPISGYEEGLTYTMKVLDGVTFVDYPDIVILYFTIIADMVVEVEMKNNVVELNKNDIVAYNKGVLIVQDKEFDLGVGSIVIADIDELNAENELDLDGKSALKVQSVRKCSEGLALNTTKPTVEEVYERLNISVSKEAGEEDILFNEDRAVSEVMDSDFVGVMTTAGFVLPDVNFDFQYLKDTKQFKLDIALVFSGIFEGSSLNETLTIKVSNLLDFELVSNIGKNINEKFRLGVNVGNRSTTSVIISSGASDSVIKNVQDVLSAVEERLGENSMENIAKIFTWNIPIATGVNISYDMDFVFRYGFSGELSCDVTSDIDFSTGIYMADGELTPYMNCEYKLVGVDLTARVVVGLKAGIINYLNFNILNIVGAGVEIEVGLYSDFYTALKLSIKNDTDVSGIGGGYASFLDTGVYWDLNLKAHLGISNILDISQRFDIIDGKHSLYSIGDREFMVNLLEVGEIENGEENDNTIVLSAQNSRMPVYQVRLFDIVTCTYRDVVVDYKDLVFNTEEDSNIIIDQNTGLISIKEGATGVDEYVTIELFSVGTSSASYVYDVLHIVMYGDKPMLDNNYFSVDKTNADGFRVEVRLNESNNGIPNTIDRIEGNNITSDDYKVYTVDGVAGIYFDKDYLLSLPCDRMYFDIIAKVDGEDFKLPISIDITTELRYNTIGLGTEGNEFILYSREQIIDLINSSRDGKNFSGVFFKLGHDINMANYENGEYSIEAILPILEFNGSFDGNGYTIYNAYITDSSSDCVGLFAKNNGVIKRLNLDINIATSRESEDIYIGGLVGQNNGVVTNVNVSGNVSNYIGGGNGINVYLGGIVGKNLGKIEHSTTDVAFGVNTKLDLWWYKHFVGGIAGQNIGEILTSRHTVENVADVVSVKVDAGIGSIVKSKLTIDNVSC